MPKEIRITPEQAKIIIETFNSLERVYQNEFNGSLETEQDEVKAFLEEALKKEK